MDPIESREYSWEYVIADKILREGPCELLYVAVVPSAATTDSAIYNGRSTSGRKILDLKVAVVASGEFRPPLPIFCDQGLYLDVGSNVSGIFVLWRDL